MPAARPLFKNTCTSSYHHNHIIMISLIRKGDNAFVHAIAWPRGRVTYVHACRSGFLSGHNYRSFQQLDFVLDAIVLTPSYFFVNRKSLCDNLSFV